MKVTDDDYDKIYMFINSIMGEYELILRENIVELFSQAERAESLSLSSDVVRESKRQIEKLLSIPVQNALSTFLTKDPEEIQLERKSLEEAIMSKSLLSGGIEHYNSSSILNRARQSMEICLDEEDKASDNV